MCVVDVQPTEAELPVWTRVEAILKYSDTVLYELQQYKGAANEIRDVSTTLLARFLIVSSIQQQVNSQRYCILNILLYIDMCLFRGLTWFHSLKHLSVVLLVPK